MLSGFVLVRAADMAGKPGRRKENTRGPFNKGSSEDCDFPQDPFYKTSITRIVTVRVTARVILQVPQIGFVEPFLNAVTIMKHLV